MDGFTRCLSSEALRRPASCRPGWGSLVKETGLWQASLGPGPNYAHPLLEAGCIPEPKDAPLGSDGPGPSLNFFAFISLEAELTQGRLK